MAVTETTKRAKEIAKKVKETPASKEVAAKAAKKTTKKTDKKSSKKVDSKKAKKSTKKTKAVKAKKVKKSGSDKKPSNNIFAKFGRYVRDSVREIKRVTWPSRKESWNLTFAVIIFSGIFTALLVLVDYIFRNILERYII